MVNGNWGSTQENAQALLALGKYARYTEGRPSNYSGAVYIGRNMLTEFDNENQANIQNADLGSKEVSIDITGEGTAYYYWVAEGVLVDTKAKEQDKGMKVRRIFFTKDGRKLESNKIKQGDVVVVDISLEANSIYKNVIVEDLLPAGFEIENPRLSSTETINWIKEDAFDPDHIDIRDDRLLLFTDLPKKENLHFRYAVRAVTRGEFVLPAISASCMYDPSIESINGQGKISVNE